MYRHILIPTDGSELANKAVMLGLSQTKSIGAKSLRLSSRQPSNVYDVHSSKMFQMTSAFGEYVEHTSIPTLGNLIGRRLCKALALWASSPVKWILRAWIIASEMQQFPGLCGRQLHAPISNSRNRPILFPRCKSIEVGKYRVYVLVGKGDLRHFLVL